METIGKLLSLIFIAVVGAGGATMYILDSGKAKVETANSVPVEIDLGKENPDLEKYREHLRQRYIEAKPPLKKEVANDSSNMSLWTDTYKNNLPTYISEQQIADMASSNDAKTLREKMNYWHSEYHKALKSNKSIAANEAYKKHKSFKYALEYKNSTFN